MTVGGNLTQYMVESRFDSLPVVGGIAQSLSYFISRYKTYAVYFLNQTVRLFLQYGNRHGTETAVNAVSQRRR